MTAAKFDRVGAGTAHPTLRRTLSRPEAARVIERLCRAVLERMAREAARKAVH